MTTAADIAKQEEEKNMQILKSKGLDIYTMLSISGLLNLRSDIPLEILTPENYSKFALFCLRDNLGFESNAEEAKCLKEHSLEPIFDTLIAYNASEMICLERTIDIFMKEDHELDGIDTNDKKAHEIRSTKYYLLDLVLNTVTFPCFSKNKTIQGYYGNIVNNLINNNVETIIKRISDNSLIEKMCEHIDCCAMQSIIAALLNKEDNAFNNKVADKLFSLFLSTSQDKVTKIGEGLVAMLSNITKLSIKSDHILSIQKIIKKENKDASVIAFKILTQYITRQNESTREKIGIEVINSIPDWIVEFSDKPKYLLVVLKFINEEININSEYQKDNIDALKNIVNATLKFFTKDYKYSVILVQIMSIYTSLFTTNLNVGVITKDFIANIFSLLNEITTDPKHSTTSFANCSVYPILNEILSIYFENKKKEDFKEFKSKMLAKKKEEEKKEEEKKEEKKKEEQKKEEQKKEEQTKDEASINSQTKTKIKVPAYSKYIKEKQDQLYKDLTSCLSKPPEHKEVQKAFYEIYKPLLIEDLAVDDKLDDLKLFEY